MIRLLRFLITGSWHEHKWEIMEKYNDIHYWNADDKLPCSEIRHYIQKCAVCGKLDEFTVER
jgi:hypothetical protein